MSIIREINNITGLKIKLKKKLFSLLIIIGAGTLARFVYLRQVPGVFISEDTYSYYQVGQRMLRELFFVDHYRAPLYSVFLPFIVNLLGGKWALVGSGVFFEKAYSVIIIQMILGVLGMVILYLSLLNLKIKGFFPVLTVLFLATNIIIFSWEKLLLTESIATFFLILTFYLSVKLLIKAKAVYFFWFLLVSVLALMLRSFSIYLPVIPLSIVILYQRKREVLIYSILAIFVYGGIIKTYSTLNYRRFGFYGLSRAADINALGKILLYKLPLDAGRDEKEIYSLVKDYQSVPHDPHPFRFLEQYNLQFEESVPRLIPLKAFSRKIILANIPFYLLRSTAELPGGIRNVSEKVMLPPENGNLESRVLNYDYSFAKIMQNLFFLIFPFIPFAVYIFIRKPSAISAAMLIAGGISLYQMIFSVYIAHGEYGRLILPAQPLMYLFVFYYLKKTAAYLFIKTKITKVKK